MKRALPGLFLLLALVAARGQISGDQLGTHDMTPTGTASVRGPVSNACLYCHAPHGAMTTPTPLWNQQLSMQSYTQYGSSTYHQTGQQPPIGSPSKLCLSCHDGTVAPGQTISFGQLNMSGTMKSSTRFGTDLSSSHPFSLRTPLTDVADINALLFGPLPQTADPAVQLVRGSIECTTCHQPHFQGLDRIVQKFLVRDGASGALCLACHDPARVVGGQTNHLAGWAGSVHATASHTVANNPYVGGYGTVAQNACVACHTPHNASGPARLLRGADQQACASCHSGANTQPAAANIFAELAKVGHPAPVANNLHDANEATLLNNNRHATCVDCHDAHAAQPTAAFALPPAIRPAQAGAAGISAADGMSTVKPAMDQYEVCLRCHGESIGKLADAKYGYLPNRGAGASDPLNVRLQLQPANPSSHPVTHDRASALTQPSLRNTMLQLDGVTPGRAMGARVFCTDCHNADDARESGGAGPNGPHGSKWTHILERRYEMSTAATPGSPVFNLYPNPDTAANGPFALCAKCHDLGLVLGNSSPFPHNKHVLQDGFSCSVCHSPHGTSTANPNLSGQRLIDFDLNVVGQFSSQPVAFNQSAKSCTLTCHNVAHDHKTY